MLLREWLIGRDTGIGASIGFDLHECRAPNLLILVHFVPLLGINSCGLYVGWLIHLLITLYLGQEFKVIYTLQFFR